MNRASRAIFVIASAFLTTVSLTTRADVASGEKRPAAELSATRLSSHINKVELGDLNRIIKERYLRVLTIKDPYDYYVHNGDMKGVQYEMIQAFVAQLNRKYVKERGLKIAFELIPVDFGQLIPMLNSGKGDIIAVGLTRTSDRDSEVKFTVPYQVVHDAIVTRTEFANESWQNKTFLVQEGSSYFHALTESGKQVHVRVVDSNWNAENMMELVSLKAADYTLVNSYWAETIGKRFKNLVILKDQPFRKKVAISWAVRKKNPKLLRELNSFIPKIRKGTLLGNTFGQKYFDDLSRIQSEDFDVASQRISKYDDSLKKYANEYGFDWRLLAALCLEESRFIQDIENRWGAIGLFQIKQSTADEPYIAIGPIRGAENFDNNIHAGVKYLAWLKNTFFDSHQSLAEEERLRFMMAAYNAGPAKVKEAMEKAKEMRLSPAIWFRNVELAMLELGIPDPVIYVSEINKHYVSYLLLGIKE